MCSCYWNFAALFLKYQRILNKFSKYKRSLIIGRILCHAHIASFRKDSWTIIALVTYGIYLTNY